MDFDKSKVCYQNANDADICFDMISFLCSRLTTELFKCYGKMLCHDYNFSPILIRSYYISFV